MYGSCSEGHLGADKCVPCARTATQPRAPLSQMKEIVPWDAVLFLCPSRVLSLCSYSRSLPLGWGKSPKASRELAFMHLGDGIKNPNISLGFPLWKELSALLPPPHNVSRSDTAGFPLVGLFHRCAAACE